MSVLNKIFKSYSEKEVKRVKPIVNKINGLEEEMTKLTDNELRAKTEYFKGQFLFIKKGFLSIKILSRPRRDDRDHHADQTLRVHHKSCGF